ncbi:MAG: CDP-glycerol glycerophosphotransferase family protein [Clostridia bacterium]|nr:CDP-glycerol glycerophosphotransferase family protein [Clostridia bacterium]
MIPKIIHYCWFGGNPLNDLAKFCIESWKKYCPDYEIIEWNENNFDINSNTYAKEAYEAKKWAFVTDFVRLHALYQFGGIYMDTDVELLKNPDEFLHNPAFFGFEDEKSIMTGMMASEKQSKWLESLLSGYANRHFIMPDGSLDLTTNVATMTNLLQEKYEVQQNNSFQKIEGVLTLYPKDFFSPKSYETGEINLTDNTVCIHHFNASWHSEEEKKEHEHYVKLVKKYGKERAEKQRIRHNQWKQLKENFVEKGILRTGVKLIRFFLKRIYKFFYKILHKIFTMGILIRNATKNAWNFSRYFFHFTRKDMWVFTSFSGQYSDSPKYLSIKLHEISPDIKIFWLVKRENIKLLPEYVVGVDIDSGNALTIRGKARVIIDNVYGDREHTFRNNSLRYRLRTAVFNFFIRIKKQKVYTTWHGTPLKRIGRDQVRNICIDFTCPKTEMILGNEFTLNIMKHLTFNRIDMKLLGTPRNDLLFRSLENKMLYKNKLELPIDKKVFLYAPTFRNDGLDVSDKNVLRSGINQLCEIDFDKLFDVLSKKFSGEWVLVCRFHYHVSEMVDWDELERKYNGKVINGNLHNDMAEYLVCADALLTDASSCMFDFALTERPCFLYFPDLDNYRDNERGFYLNVEELPFSVAKTFDALVDDIVSFDSDIYRRSVSNMIQKLKCVDDHQSSERIVKYILEDQNRHTKRGETA